METIGANNGFFEFVTSEEEFIIDGKSKNVKRNFVRRPPGIRALIVDKDKKSILFSKDKFRFNIDRRIISTSIAKLGRFKNETIFEIGSNFIHRRTSKTFCKKAP